MSIMPKNVSLEIFRNVLGRSTDIMISSEINGEIYYLKVENPEWIKSDECSFNLDPTISIRCFKFELFDRVSGYVKSKMENDLISHLLKSSDKMLDIINENKRNI